VDVPSTWGYMLLIASMATLGHLLLIFAYARASAASLTPYGYSQILIAMLGGWIIFNHLPDAWALFGMALIAVCGCAGGWLSAREGRAAL
jgi:drug/metabolite transporter (DMT)-like permease